MVGLILDVLDVAVDTPVEVIPGCVLRRLTRQEIDALHASLPSNVRLILQAAFEFEEPKEAGSYLKLEPHSWRYWAIENTTEAGLNGLGRLQDLAKACRLCTVELPCDLIFTGSELTDGNFAHPVFGNTFWRLRPGGKQTHVDGAGLRQIAVTWDMLSALPPGFQPIQTAIDRYHRLSQMANSDDLYPLGVFAVMESLLTHDQKTEHDSLTHQIKTKMALLDNRFSERLDYSCFGSAKSETVWGKLYSYRSAIAHGGTPDFDGTLAILRDRLSAVTFVDAATKALLRHALAEPQLILDLRPC